VVGRLWLAAVGIPAVARASGATEHAAGEGARADGLAGPVPSEYETVVRTASASDPRPREDDAASASTITNARTPRSGESLPQLLSELPAVAVTRLGGLGALATVSLRGSTSNQVLVYVDGVPLNSAVGGGVDLGAIPLGDIERIEVYRGMTPIGFGASAMGGVVSVTTRAPRDTAAASYAGLGSFGERSCGARAAWVGETARLYAGAHVLGSEGDFSYRSDSGTAFELGDDHDLRRQNNALRQLDGIVRGSLRFADRRELVASVSLFDRDQGLPGLGIYPTREAAQKARDRLEAMKLIIGEAAVVRRD
jgi:iron complex outermembrane receptor protein